MHHIGLASLAFLAAFGAVAAQGADKPDPKNAEVRAAPNFTVREAGTGCLIGGSTGAALAALGTIGLGTVPAAALGCGFGAAVSPIAGKVYDRYRVEAFLAVDDAITGLYGWWQEQKMRDYTP